MSGHNRFYIYFTKNCGGTPRKFLKPRFLHLDLALFLWTKNGSVQTLLALKVVLFERTSYTAENKWLKVSKTI